MEIPDSLLCIFTGKVEQRNGSYVVEVPRQELETGAVREGKTYRLALFSAAKTGDIEKAGESDTPVSSTQLGTPQDHGSDKPPVEEGEIREVRIEDIGEQGDGIARIGPGYIVFVSDTEIGDTVRVRISDTRDNFAFGEVVDQL